MASLCALAVSIPVLAWVWAIDQRDQPDFSQQLQNSYSRMISYQELMLECDPSSQDYSRFQREVSVAANEKMRLKANLLLRTLIRLVCATVIVLAGIVAVRCRPSPERITNKDLTSRGCDG